MSSVLCCLAMHSCASPVGSYMLPITANTWSSSVNDVHAASAAAELHRADLLEDRHDLAAVDAAVLVDVVDVTAL